MTEKPAEDEPVEDEKPAEYQPRTPEELWWQRNGPGFGSRTGPGMSHAKWGRKRPRNE